MSTENDAPTGGESLSVDEAATRFAASQSTSVTDQEEEAEPAEDKELTDETTEGEQPKDDEEGDDGADDQAEDDDEESAQGRFVADNAKVRLEDGTITSIAELKKGSLLHADYTRKTQEAAELRRSAESQSAAAKQLETQLSEQREQVVALVRSIMPQPPSPAMAATDPYGYTTQKAQYDAFMAHVQHLEQQNQTSKAQRDAEASTARERKSATEMAALIEKVPAFKDQTRFAGFINDVREHGLSFYGFNPQELAEGIGYDHRMALVMRDAVQWRKLQASKPKVQAKVEGRPPIQKGGKRLTPDAARAKTASVAMDRLKQSGTVDDAVAAYLAKQG